MPLSLGMKHRPRLFVAVLASLLLPAAAQDEEPRSATENLKDSVREWIETMREIQREETSWERDQEILRDQRGALESEIAQLEERIAKAKEEKEGADREVTEEVEQRDALIEAKEMLTGEVRTLEDALLERLPSFPKPLRDEPRVAQLIEEVRKDAKLEGKEAEGGLSKRLNNVLNLLKEAEEWQQTVSLRDELHQAPDGREFNMKVVYFGFGIAYAVNESGDFALVGKPGPEGWKFEPNDELAPQIGELVDVLTGDLDAKFVNLPISLP